MTRQRIKKKMDACPFCGRGDRLFDCTDDGRHWIECGRCGATGPINGKYAGCDDDPVIEWGTRATQRKDLWRFAAWLLNRMKPIMLNLEGKLVPLVSELDERVIITVDQYEHETRPWQRLPDAVPDVAEP